MNKRYPRVIDAHVHLFPDRMFDAIWRWFEQHAWPMRYQLYAQEVARFLLSRGVSRLVALKDWARDIGRWTAEGRDVWCFFDNDVKSAAPADARHLSEMVRKSGTGVG